MTVYEDTVALMKNLNESDLLVVNNIVKRFVFSMYIGEQYKPLSEKEFFDRLAVARKHAEEGKVKDAKEVANNLREKYGLA